MPETKLISKPLQTERLGNGHRKLLRTLTIKVDEQYISVPENTQTDYSSIPWFGRMLVRWSKVDIAGVVHDWLYARGKLVNEPILRSKADEIWRIVALAGDHHANFFKPGFAGFF